MMEDLYDDDVVASSSHQLGGGGSVIGKYINIDMVKVVGHAFKRFRMHRFLFTCIMNVVCENDACFMQRYDVAN